MIKKLKKINNKYPNLTPFIFYSFFTTLFFIYFYKNAPPIQYDAYEYNKLADNLIKNNFNLLSLNFGQRTFVYPLFLAVIKVVSIKTHINQYFGIYLAQFLLLILSNYVVYTTVKKYQLNLSKIFLTLSSFNVITLSFSVTLLTENLAIIFTALFFYFLNQVKSRKNMFIIGLLSGLFLLLRPSSLSLVFVISLFLLFEKYEGKFKKILSYAMGVSIILLISITNTYKISKTFGIYNPKVLEISTLQMKIGASYLKYETNINKNQGVPQVIYLDQKTKNEIDQIYCNKEFGCLIKYWLNKPFDYGIIWMTHLFNIFDRIYVDTYVRNIYNEETLLIIFNYIVLSSFSVYTLLFFNKKSPLFIKYSYLLIVGTIAIYLPTSVEPRFSAPIFPLMLVIASSYIMTIIKRFKLKYIVLNGVFVFIFFIISQLVNLQLTFGGKFLYK